MKLNRKELLEALTLTSVGLAKQEIIEQSASFIFTKGRVFTYNDEVAVSHPVEVDFEGAIPSKEFLALIKKLKTEEVELEISDGELLLKGSRAKAGIRLEAEIKLPIDEIGSPDGWVELPDNFCEAAKFCLFSASTDTSNQVLTCIHLTDSYVESTDNYRATRYFLTESDAFEESMLVPTFAIKEIIKFNPTEYTTTEGWIHFKNNKDVMFSCRMFDETFPEIGGHLEVEGEEIIFPSTLNEILDRASVMSDGERVTVIAAKNKLTIKTQGDSGWFEEVARIDYDGEEIEFEIQPEYLAQIMKHTDTATVGKLLKFEVEDTFIHIVSRLAGKN